MVWVKFILNLGLVFAFCACSNSGFVAATNSSQNNQSSPSPTPNPSPNPSPVPTPNPSPTPSPTGATLFVDTQVATACATYNPTSRNCTAGTYRVFRDLSSAAAQTNPGDQVLVRQGSFSTPLAPTRSGTLENPIFYKPYESEVVTFTGINSPVISLTNVNNLVIEGFSVDNVLAWGRIQDSDYNTIKNMKFRRATSTGTTGSLKLVRANYTKILNNEFNEGNDNITMQESDYNVIESNNFLSGRHSLLSVRCSNYNVFRSNSFSNVLQKAAEIYDCEGVSDAPVRYDATKYNVWENNIFSWTKASERAVSHDYNGIQYAGQNGIVRKNIFYDNQGGALGVQVYADEALVNNSHRIYHNTFYNNRCYGFVTSDDNVNSYFGIVFVNNILFGNVDCNGGPTQFLNRNTSAVTMINNSTANPSFVNAASHDFTLQAVSTQVNAATFLTRTTTAGSGTTMVVEDAGYFYGGHGIPGEFGDEIQLQGQTVTARITAINYSTRTLTLDTSLTWQANTGVSLKYLGSAPDMGAIESH